MNNEIVERLCRKRAEHIKTNGETPNCFMFALDAALDGNLPLSAYSFFEKLEVEPLFVHTGSILEAIYGNDGYGSCSEFGLEILYPLSQRRAARHSLSKNIAAALLAQPADRRVLVSAPGLDRHHARAIVPGAENYFIVDSIDPELARQIPVSAARNEILWALATGTVFTLGFKIDFPKPK